MTRIRRCPKTSYKQVSSLALYVGRAVVNFGGYKTEMLQDMVSKMTREY